MLFLINVEYLEATTKRLIEIRAITQILLKYCEIIPKAMPKILLGKE